LSALTFANLLHDIFGVDVPVGVIVSPASDLAAIAAYVEEQRSGGSKRPTYDSVHGRKRHRGPRQAISHWTSSSTRPPWRPHRHCQAPVPRSARSCSPAPPASSPLPAAEWLERMDLVDGKVITLVRAKDSDAAWERLDATFDSGDPKLLAHYRELAADHLVVLAGDKGDANLGLEHGIWQQLADTVDLIVDPAALVNHVLPYSQLFGPNVVGTAELIRIALLFAVARYGYVLSREHGRACKSWSNGKCHGSSATAGVHRQSALQAGSRLAGCPIRILTILDKNGGLPNTSTWIGFTPQRHIGVVLLCNAASSRPQKLGDNSCTRWRKKKSEPSNEGELKPDSD